MSKFDLSEKLKKSAKSIKSTVEQLPESMGNINLVDSVKDLADKGTDTIQNFVKNSEKTIQTITESLAKPVEVQGKITIQDALKIIYFVIAADGKMDQKEKEMFSEIGKQFDPEFIEYQKEFEYELNQMIEKAKDEDFEDNIRDYIRDTIENSKTSKITLNLQGYYELPHLIHSTFSNSCEHPTNHSIHYNPYIFTSNIL